MWTMNIELGVVNEPGSKLDEFWEKTKSNYIMEFLGNWNDFQWSQNLENQNKTW